MGTWRELQTLLETLLGSRHVYFNPPSSIKMEYPAIVYSRNNIRMSHADNQVYRKTNRYQVIVVSRYPDEPVVDKISSLPMCSYDRSYASDNLYHEVFNLYY